jgi:hypothetical protein
MLWQDGEEILEIVGDLDFLAGPAWESWSWFWHATQLNPP